MDVKLHSTGVIFDDRLWMSCQVIQDFGDFLDVLSVALGCSREMSLKATIRVLSNAMP